ncbi:hypothetical protein [Methylobacterium trifolii]|uniref:Phospholipase A2 domain-containing protein n=1 Tax=Methylobacterium trifolii TaxID=1003092 RepID=A0ABQ4U4K1_9HYPH|nr:hypothetical protein [Methylobacterium trifolii]GJE62186.1 hypothetical protein MPOCJGCO_4316 [Methylobacterium trifolii]
MTTRATIIKIAAPVLLAACWAGPAWAEPAALGGPKMLVYGNYCGLGNNAPLQPIDVLDAACARHDECTPDNDLPTKACNLRLEREAQAIANDPHQPGDLRTMAGFVAAFASGHQSKVIPDMVAVSVKATTPRTTFTTLR